MEFGDFLTPHVNCEWPTMIRLHYRSFSCSHKQCNTCYKDARTSTSSENVPLAIRHSQSKSTIPTPRAWWRSRGSPLEPPGPRINNNDCIDADKIIPMPSAKTSTGLIVSFVSLALSNLCTCSFTAMGRGAPSLTTSKAFFRRNKATCFQP